VESWSSAAVPPAMRGLLEARMMGSGGPDTRTSWGERLGVEPGEEWSSWEWNGRTSELSTGEGVTALRGMWALSKLLRRRESIGGSSIRPPPTEVKTGLEPGEPRRKWSFVGLARLRALPRRSPEGGPSYEGDWAEGEEGKEVGSASMATRLLRRRPPATRVGVLLLVGLVGLRGLCRFGQACAG
jgi:hypothetical protein